jgi:plastocyanin
VVKRRGWAAAVLALLALVGCGGSSDDESGGAGEAPEPNTVVLRDIAFKPKVLKVEAGTTVTWKFEDQGITHDVKAEDGSFASETMDSGTFEHTFEEPGTYSYFCSLHPATMRGEIRVT